MENSSHQNKCITNLFLLFLHLHCAAFFSLLSSNRICNTSFQDREMYYAETDTPAMARTSNLNEELGQVR